MGEPKFDTDYWHNLDTKYQKEFGIEPRNIGISHGVGDVLQGLKTRIALGISKIELGFMGTGKGSRYSPTGFTPESFSKMEREDIRNLAKVNDVQVSVHASPNAGYLSGWNQDRFDKENQARTLKEIERAIDFAGDTVNTNGPKEGTPIVVHLGEFPRGLTQAEEEYYKQSPHKFASYKDEKAPIRLVDTKTGKIEALRSDLEVYVPEEDEKTGQPIPDPKTGRYKFIPRGIEYYKDPVHVKKIKDQLAQEKGPEGRVFDQKVIDEMNDPAQLLYVDFLRKELEKVESEEKLRAREAVDTREVRDELSILKKEYDDALKEDPYEAQQIMRKILENTGIKKKREEIFKTPEDFQKYKEDPTNYLNEFIGKLDRQIEQYDEGAKSYGRERQEVIRNIQSKKPIKEYALDQSADGISDAAMRAYAVEQAKGFKQPLYIAPENWTPEIYGSHPQELKEIIIKSREVMAEKLHKFQGKSEEEANKIAEDHIKATFDIGHANMWRQYYQGKPDDFKKWLLTQVKDLTDSGVLGHVHLTDNFGYGDEHLSPGEGNAPVKEFMDHLKEIDFKGEIIVEPGGQGEGREYQSVLAGWRTARSPIYRIDSVQQSWTDIEGSYLRSTPSPNYMIGEAAARFSKDWSVWSETELH